MSSRKSVIVLLVGCLAAVTAFALGHTVLAIVLALVFLVVDKAGRSFRNANAFMASVSDPDPAIERVAELHVLVEYSSKQSGSYWSACQACGYESDDLATDPCPTLAALRGVS
ncbi:MAG TPA: hypothetical protein VIP06_02850 [Nocardioides sp.]